MQCARRLGICLAVFLFGNSCQDQNQIPRGLIEFKPYADNPVFAGAPAGSWDPTIRERGWVMFEDGLHHLWYTGYAEPDGIKQLGYATSPDGIIWNKHEKNPLNPDSWIEDVSVYKFGSVYFMMAEGVHDWPHLLTSTDRLNWTEQGSLLIHDPDGAPIADPADENSHAGTPILLKEHDRWLLYFERSDTAVWLATSMDSIPLNWTKVQKEPVLSPGPGKYDNIALAADCIVKIDHRYCMYYHATAETPWNRWCVCLAYSDDLIHWTKYEKNPIGYYGDAPMLVFNGKACLLFVTDSGREMKLYFPAQNIPFPERME